MRWMALVSLLVVGCSQLVGVDDLHVGAGAADAPIGPVIDAKPGTAADAPLDGPMSSACDRIDLLFVIDDSGSMAEEQGNLANSIPSFLEVLDDAVGASGQPLDYHLGITTTSRDIMYTMKSPVPGGPDLQQTEMGDDGELRGACGLDRKWIERGDASRASVAACRAQVGTTGSSVEMPLYAAKLATSARVLNGGPNAGFLRATAPLVIVSISDEDDCSREDNNFTTDASGDPCVAGSLMPVTAYRDYFDLLKGRHDLWSYAVVANVTASQCTSTFGDAMPARRMQDFMASSPDNTVSTSICSGNLALALQSVLEVVQASCAH